MKMTLQELLEYYAQFPIFYGSELSDVNQIGSLGDAPMHLASRRGALDEMQILIDHGANIDLVGDFGATPLHCADLPPENRSMF